MLNTEEAEAYQRLQITMPNEKVAELDKERGSVPRSTYLANLVGQKVKRGKRIYPSGYTTSGGSWLYEFVRFHEGSSMGDIEDSMYSSDGVMVLNGEQLLRLTSSMLKFAEQCRTNIEDIEIDTYLSSTAEWHSRQRKVVNIMKDLRGCIIHLRLLGVDEYIINDLEEAYNNGILKEEHYMDEEYEHDVYSREAERHNIEMYRKGLEEEKEKERGL